ncbi:MAG: hypothetical protein ABEJ08_01395 [Halobacteriaceae archaeon]
MPSRPRSVALLVGLVVVAGLAVGGAASGAVGGTVPALPASTDDAAANGTAAPDAVARPSTPNATASHDVLSGTAAVPDGSRITAVQLRYGDGATVSLDGVGPGDVTPSVFRNSGTTAYHEESLNATDVTIGERTVRVALATPVTVDGNDEVGIHVAGVRNPTTTGRVNVTLVVERAEGSRIDVNATAWIQPPAPSLAPQGRVGSEHRLGIDWPAGADGFLVVRTADGTTVGVSHHDYASDRSIDVILPSLVSAEVAPGSTLTVTAHRDADGDGAFDAGTDPAYRDGAAVVRVTIEDAFATTTTTRGGSSDAASTSRTPSTSTSTAPTSATTSGDSTATSGGLPGLGTRATGVAAVVGGLLLARRATR